MADVSSEVGSQLILSSIHPKIKNYPIADYLHHTHTHTHKLSLLDGHVHSLSDRIGQLDNHRTAPSHVALVLPDHPANPLLPQLQTASKFAVMVSSQCLSQYQHWERVNVVT